MFFRLCIASFAVLASASLARAGSNGYRLVNEGVVDAPPAGVWEALTTDKGQESWNVAHARIDLRVGGKMRTHYDPKGTLGDNHTIENTILSFDPERMLSFHVTRVPDGLPASLVEPIQKIWTVIYLDESGPGRTRVRCVGVGYTDDDGSKKLREFFDKGNAYTIQKLQKHFARKEPATPR